jgi:plasmid stabilization system protein ParE
MAFRVEVLPRAKADLESIWLWLAERAPSRGADWFNGLERAIYSLSESPDRCPLARSLSTASGPVRQLLYGRYPHVYKIYFHVVGDTVEVMHIRHGARKIPRRADL